MNDNSDTNIGVDGCCDGCSCNNDTIVNYSVNGKAFETFTLDDEIIITVKIGVEKKKENKED